jgi:hypothetical protein
MISQESIRLRRLPSFELQLRTARIPTPIVEGWFAAGLIEVIDPY